MSLTFTGNALNLEQDTQALVHYRGKAVDPPSEPSKYMLHTIRSIRDFSAFTLNTRLLKVSGLGLAGASCSIASSTFPGIFCSSTIVVSYLRVPTRPINVDNLVKSGSSLLKMSEEPPKEESSGGCCSCCPTCCCGSDAESSMSGGGLPIGVCLANGLLPGGNDEDLQVSCCEPECCGLVRR